MNTWPLIGSLQSQKEKKEKKKEKKRRKKEKKKEKKRRREEGCVRIWAVLTCAAARLV